MVIFLHVAEVADGFFDDGSDRMDTYGRALELMSYILDNQCFTLVSFCECVLADVRAGVHCDWYRSLFSDDGFRQDVSDWCEGCRFGTLCFDIGYVEGELESIRAHSGAMWGEEESA